MNISSQKILLVDDNPKNLQVAMNILKEYNVLYAQSGTKALSLLDENDFDLILLDIVMPGLNGYEVCKIIKENEKTKNIPLIFLTVKDDEKDIVEGFDLGAVDYVVKPFHSQVLLKRVELHLNLSRTVKDLKDLNENLNEIVNIQIEDIRKKDEILSKQSKILALSEMIDMMSEQLTHPLGILKLQNQALEIKNLNEDICHEDIRSVINTNNKQLNIVDSLIKDFNSFFSEKTKVDIVNLNVMIDSAVLFFKDLRIKEKVAIRVDGDINIKVPFVKSELKHILIKLIFTLIQIFKEYEIKKREVNISFYDTEDFIQVDINSNICELVEDRLENSFTLDNLTNDKSLGLHLVKMLVEKNLSDISVGKNNTGICYIIKIYK